jgi:hypothetical protein
LIKTRLQHYATATAINILRLGAWWVGRGREQTRRSPLLKYGTFAGEMRLLHM